MKTPVTLESTSTYTENDSKVLVVSKEMGRYKEVLYVRVEDDRLGFYLIFSHFPFSLS